MWVYSIFLSSLSLICSLTLEINYQTRKILNRQTDKQLSTHREWNWYSPHKGSSKVSTHHRIVYFLNFISIQIPLEEHEHTLCTYLQNYLQKVIRESNGENKKNDKTNKDETNYIHIQKLNVVLKCDRDRNGRGIGYQSFCQIVGWYSIQGFCKHLNIFTNSQRDALIFIFCSSCLSA